MAFVFPLNGKGDRACKASLSERRGGARPSCRRLPHLPTISWLCAFCWAFSQQEAPAGAGVSNRWDKAPLPLPDSRQLKRARAAAMHALARSEQERGGAVRPRDTGRVMEHICNIPKRRRL
eukprot:350556-Chlamydomonas_euryale.AAC.12